MVVLLLVVSVVLVLLVVLELALKHPPPPKEGLLGVPPSILPGGLHHVPLVCGQDVGVLQLGGAS